LPILIFAWEKIKKLLEDLVFYKYTVSSTPPFQSTLTFKFKNVCINGVGDAILQYADISFVSFIILYVFSLVFNFV